MLFLYLVGVVSIVQASCLHGTSHLVRQVTPNKTVEVSKFGYTGKIGPSLWHTLAKENSLCATGTYQSPINIGELRLFMCCGDCQRRVCILMNSSYPLTLAPPLSARFSRPARSLDMFSSTETFQVTGVFSNPSVKS
jgi:hypothetical protein